ncbi:hypothetical protein GTW98_33200 [Streptomyces sp. SID8375]|uniref:hypothetical protein n=1 Tax=unclassified Streptomyces TaxID=2593676 RepID=UPI001319C896|nr:MULTISPECIES: hypothetical protein [unclassified Streptomyces]MYX11593.1 hypothetical protein [Streptomyces sp. SID8375]
MTARRRVSAMHAAPVPLIRTSANHLAPILLKTTDHHADSTILMRNRYMDDAAVPGGNRRELAAAPMTRPRIACVDNWQAIADTASPADCPDPTTD